MTNGTLTDLVHKEWILLNQNSSIWLYKGMTFVIFYCKAIRYGDTGNNKCS
jgi:hypothetical protein